MSFTDDAKDAPFTKYAFHRPALTINVVLTDGEQDECISIDLPELSLQRDECDPAWLAMTEES